MRYEELVAKSSGAPIIDAGIVLAGQSDAASIRVQISRWAGNGRLIALGRGMYALPEAFRKKRIFEPCLSYRLVHPSYISLEKALEYHGLIPEAVTVFTGITTKRPGRIENPLGIFDYRHIKNSLFWGYGSVTIEGQTAFYAHPEKALLDYFYMKREVVTGDFLEEMRLQNVEIVDLDRLETYARKFDKPGMWEAGRKLKAYIIAARESEKAL